MTFLASLSELKIREENEREFRMVFDAEKSACLCASKSCFAHFDTIPPLLSVALIKVQNGDILVSANPVSPGKWPIDGLKEIVVFALSSWRD